MAGHPQSDSELIVTLSISRLIIHENMGVATWRMQRMRRVFSHGCSKRQRCGFAEWQQPFDAIEPPKALFCSYHFDVLEKRLVSWADARSVRRWTQRRRRSRRTGDRLRARA